MDPLIVTRANAADQIEEARLRASLPPGHRYEGCFPKTLHSIYHRGIKEVSDYFPRIPRDRWKELILAGKGTFLSSLTHRVLPPHDQGNTNYCWAHGSVRALEVLRVFELQPPKILSAESVAVPLTGGRNRGGSPDEALVQLRRSGACEQSFWPLNDRNIKNASPGWIENANLHVIIDWVHVRNYDDQITLALHRVPVPIGLGWWGHLVCQLDPVILPDGSVGIGCDNSWGEDYGNYGYFLLDEEKGTADLGAFAPISASFALL